VLYCVELHCLEGALKKKKKKIEREYFLIKIRFLALVRKWRSQKLTSSEDEAPLMWKLETQRRLRGVKATAIL
jgi:hypothetical protein